MKYVLLTFKKDARYKEGERLYSKEEVEADSESTIQYITERRKSLDFRCMFTPATKIVRNFMTGSEVEIAWDTPHCCDPSTETYWSM